MSDNLDLWKQLAKTDPDQTQTFKRAGGFGGTAVKPIYIIQKMTHIFGPCGVGWVIDKPEFETVPTDEGLVSVHCTVMVRVRIPGTEELTAPIPGVGGDQAVAKRSSGKFVDDEAFKKAYTDAIGNALKFLGMSADIHMGRFDDSKYVNSLREEKQATREERANGKPKNGGYQNRYVKPDNEQSGNDEPPSAMDDDPALPDPVPDEPEYDPETGEVKDDGSLTVILQNNNKVGVADLKEASQEIAAVLKQDDVGWFESEQVLGANDEIIRKMKPSWQTKLTNMAEAKKAAEAASSPL